MNNIEIKTAIVETDFSDHFSNIFAAKKIKIDAKVSEQYIFKGNISDECYVLLCNNVCQTL